MGSLGNHEFDNGVSGLTPFIKNLTCPVLAANLVLDKEPTLESEVNLMKSVTIDVNGTKIGVIGYLTPETKVLAIRNNVEYIEETEAIKVEAAKLKQAGVNIIIALGHSGFAKDCEIAQKVEDVDLVIGGHTNTFLWNGKAPDEEKPEGSYPTIMKQKSGRMVPAVQAYAYTKYLGSLHLVFDRKGEMMSYDGSPILLNNSIPQDPDVLKIIDLYKSEVMKITETVVGTIGVNLDGQSCRLKECNMGNLITDAMVNKYASQFNGSGWTDAAIAIIQGGGIRASFAHDTHKPPSNITKGDLLNVMPFDGNTVKVSIKGWDIWRMLEHSVAYYQLKQAKGQFLQMSGLKVVYDMRMKPMFRVQKVYVLCCDCDVPKYSLLDKSQEYNVLMPAFISRGGDGYFMFEGLPAVSLDYDELSATIQYIGQRSPILTATEDRIILKNLDKWKPNSATIVSSSLTLLLTMISIKILQ